MCGYFYCFKLCPCPYGAKDCVQTSATRTDWNNANYHIVPTLVLFEFTGVPCETQVQKFGDDAEAKITCPNLELCHGLEKDVYRMEDRPCERCVSECEQRYLKRSEDEGGESGESVGKEEESGSSATTAELSCPSSGVDGGESVEEAEGKVIQGAGKQ